MKRDLNVEMPNVIIYLCGIRGVPVAVHEFEGMVHGFFSLGKYFPQAVKAVERAGDALRAALLG